MKQNIIYRGLFLEENEDARNILLDNLISYLHTDSIWYFLFQGTNMFSYLQGDSLGLSELQKAVWNPILRSIEGHLQLKERIHTTNSIQQNPQSPQLVTLIKKDLQENTTATQLVAMETLVKSFKSLLLPYAFYSKLITLDDAIKASSIELDFQTSKWGLLEEHHNYDHSQLNVTVSMAALCIRSQQK